MHEAADGVLTRLEADRLRARARELVAELDTLTLSDGRGPSDDFLRWAASSSVILAELAHG